MKQETYNAWAFFLGVIQLGIVCFTAYWAYRYTKETIRLRESAQKQAASTDEQLGLAKASFDDLKEERRRGSYPFFVMEVKHDGGNIYSLRVTNKGAPVYDIKFVGRTTGLNFPNQLENYLDKDGKTARTFTGPHPLPATWMFDVHYFTMLGQKCVGHYLGDGSAIRYLGHADHGVSIAFGVGITET